ncbi:RRM domain RNA-binding protein [Microdochium trichocladiopsis]|uniref:RRM domain RNA-binding protein n=1 Tax=Microdochium trichocladiopsis TaxID=1682393 RepID=A0A9P8XT56_9PEZI|nr:RRM domain RNA-binding protein [Microdochium trichocladiopsis]KAH7014121.1 RRM domain RNA-binding protein [Microdochium trichocladiopsis]
MPARLFVGNLSWSVDDGALHQAFSQYGNVVKAHVLKDRETGRSRGFGFVEFEQEADAENAINGLNEQDLNGRNIRVSHAKPQNH